MATRKIDDRPLLTPDDVAERLGVPKATIYVWSTRKTSGLVFMKVGRHLRVHPADLDAYLDAARRKSAQA